MRTCDFALQTMCRLVTIHLLTLLIGLVGLHKYVRQTKHIYNAIWNLPGTPSFNSVCHEGTPAI